MKSARELFAKWSIATKLVALFVMFGIIPMAAVGMIGFNAAEDMKAKLGAQFMAEASNLADLIDRKLYERYSDVQAFGLNDVIARKSEWYDNTTNNKISQVMNQYVAAYSGTYDLALLVDLDGEVIAVNFNNAEGKPIDVQWLFTKNLKDTPWFQALAAGTFTTSMPFAASGNGKSTGTFIEDVHVNKIVKQALGTDGLVIGFSAPVHDENGKVVAYWSNRASFGLV